MKYFIVLVFIILSISAADASMPLIFPSRFDKHSIQKDSTQKGALSYLYNLKPRNITKLTGRKFSLKEKIALAVLQHRIKKQIEHPDTEEKKDNGKTAFILGLIGFIGLFIPFLDLASIPLAILAIVIGSKAKKEDRYNKKAHLGIIFGVVTLALLVIVGLTVAIVLTVSAHPG